MIRYGLVGSGRWGANYFRAARDVGARVTHVYRFSTVPDEDTFVCGSLRELLDSPVDAVIVATPPHARIDICEEVLERCRPLIVEKPLALSTAEAERIASAAEVAEVPWLVMHQHLFAPPYEYIRDEVSNMRDLAVVSHAGGPGPVRGYSALWDYGPHDVAMILGLFRGNKIEIENAKQEGAGTFEVAIDAGLHFAVMRVSNEAPFKHRVFEVSTSEGRVLQYDDSKPTGEKLRVDGEIVKVSPELSLTRALRVFTEAVVVGNNDWRFGDFGVGVVRVLERANKMIQGGE